MLQSAIGICCKNFYFHTMTNKPLLRFLLTLNILFTAIAAYAAVPVVHISPRPKWLNTSKSYDKQVPARDVENGYFYQLYEQQIHVENKAQYTHIIRQIVSEAGIQNGSEISITFDPSFERLDVHDITVWRDGKPQTRLSAGAFKMIADETELSKFIYQGTYSAYCILRDIRKGDRIEYSYTLTGRNPIMGDKFCRSTYLQLGQPVAHIYVSVLASPQRIINFKSFNNVPKMVTSVKNGLKCYEWENFQVKAGQDFNNQAGFSTSYGYVQMSDFSNWNEVATWASKTNPPPAAVSGELAKEVATLKAAAAGDKSKYFRSAVKLVQDEVRYMGIEMGQYSHKANKPEAVFSRRYGDCKDKSQLLIAILNADSIPASMVLINASARSMTDQYLPSAYDFNHATVVATVNGKQVWIDPTIAYQRGIGTDLYYPMYAKGLIVGPATTALTNIPPSKTGLINCVEFYDIKKDPGKVTLDVTTTYTLNEANQIRAKLASASITETEKSYLEYYQKIYPKIKSTDTVTIRDNPDKNELTTIEHYAVPDMFKKDSTTEKYVASLYANYVSEQMPDINTKFRYPRDLNYPYTIDYTINVQLPGGWNIDGDSYELKRDAYQFAWKESASGDTLTLNYKFKYLLDFLPVNKIDEYADDIKQLKDNHLSYRFSYNANIANGSFKVNNLMLIIAGVWLLVLLGACIKIYRTETPGIVFEPGANFKPLGGWLILIAIGLPITVIVVFVGLCEGNLFDIYHWNAAVRPLLPYRVMLVFELLGNITIMCYAAFCFILIITKRDILPKFMIGLYLCGVAFYGLDIVAVWIIFGKQPSDHGVTLLVRCIVASAIWIPYFMRSSRVRETFIVPYPPNNYRYEKPEPPEQPIPDAPADSAI